jgi:hypothetical protein
VVCNFSIAQQDGSKVELSLVGAFEQNGSAAIFDST